MPVYKINNRMGSKIIVVSIILVIVLSKLWVDDNKRMEEEALYDKEVLQKDYIYVHTYNTPAYRRENLELKTHTPAVDSSFVPNLELDNAIYDAVQRLKDDE